MRTVSITDPILMQEIITDCKVCFVGVVNEDGFPYVIPMTFAAIGLEKVVLHCAQKGSFWASIQANPKVCVTWNSGEKVVWQDETVGSSYRMQAKSVVAFGSAQIITNFEQKYELLRCIMGQYSNLQFDFSTPTVNNVGVVQIDVDRVSAKSFGVFI